MYEYNFHFVILVLFSVHPDTPISKGSILRLIDHTSSTLFEVFPEFPMRIGVAQWVS